MHIMTYKSESIRNTSFVIVEHEQINKKILPLLPNGAQATGLLHYLQGRKNFDAKTWYKHDR